MVLHLEMRDQVNLQIRNTLAVITGYHDIISLNNKNVGADRSMSNNDTLIEGTNLVRMWPCYAWIELRCVFSF